MALIKYGKSFRAQRYFCKSCKVSFQLDYNYNACKKGYKELIIEMTFNSAGIRDIARVLKVAVNTVLNTLRKLKPTKVDAIKHYHSTDCHNALRYKNKPHAERFINE